ncbi:RNA binding protein [Colletotrichum tabaci]|uniref:RNA binding protein n=1 Tax=Colletotrichum tabaci TaxID=1209068 RepID=A0AAV9TXM3_9PEZI
MADKLDRSLDEILGEKKADGPRNRRGGGGGGGGGGGAPRRRERERQENPRDGVRKSFRDEPRNLDSEWVHDRFEEHDTRRGPAPRRRRDEPEQRDFNSAKIRVENVHYELTPEDLEELFNRIGPVAKLDLKYDRAGRSEGIAFVTMESREDALEAVKEFDGANANGQPIRLSIMPGGPGPRSRNPFDSAVMPGRPLAERISVPGGRSRSMSPGRKYDVDEAASRGIDRYVPGNRSGNRSRSPIPRRRGGGGGGRRPGGRREGGGRDSGRDGGRDGGRDQEGARGGRSGREGRTRKTQEELDAEMADYFGGGNAGETAPQPNGGATAAAATPAVPATNDDIDMIE